MKVVGREVMGQTEIACTLHFVWGTGWLPTSQIHPPNPFKPLAFPISGIYACNCFYIGLPPPTTISSHSIIFYEGLRKLRNILNTGETFSYTVAPATHFLWTPHKTPQCMQHVIQKICTVISCIIYRCIQEQLSTDAAQVKNGHMRTHIWVKCKESPIGND